MQAAFRSIVDAVVLWAKIIASMILMLAMTASLILAILVAPELNTQQPHFLQEKIVQPLQASRLLRPEENVVWTSRTQYKWVFGFEDTKYVRFEAAFMLGRQLTIHELDILADQVRDGKALKWHGVGPIAGTTRELGFEIDHDGYVSWIAPEESFNLPVEPLPFNTEIVVQTVYHDGRITWQRFVLVCENGRMSTIEPTPDWEGPTQ